MASIIEQAAERLAQLRQAGIVVPGVTADEPTVEPAAAPATAPTATTLRRPAAPSTSDKTAAGATPGDASAAPTARPPAAGSAMAADPASEDASAAAADASAAPPAASSSRHITLDLTALAEAGIETPVAQRSNKSDQYRVIKRPLIKNAMNRGAAPIKHGNLIMVTSALAGEGKSFTSINLAMSIAAELDNTVMLVDADVARPSVLRMLGLPPSPGLLDILESSADVPSVLLRTNVEKLTVLPSGTPHHRATELLASEAMRQLLDDMATRYADRIVIFDSPPLLLTTESRVLASHMGQIVIVVQAEKTLQASVQQALATIESCPVKLMLLNQARSDRVGAYGYGYGYGHGYGAAAQPAGRKAT